MCCVVVHIGVNAVADSTLAIPDATQTGHRLQVAIVTPLALHHVTVNGTTRYESRPTPMALITRQESLVYDLQEPFRWIAEVSAIACVWTGLRKRVSRKGS